MPTTTLDELTMVLGTSGETVKIVVDPVTGRPLEEDAANRPGRCDWAAANHSVDLATAVSPAGTLLAVWAAGTPNSPPSSRARPPRACRPPQNSLKGLDSQPRIQAQYTYRRGLQ